MKHERYSTYRAGRQFVVATISTMMVLLLLGLAVTAVLAGRNLSTYVREHISFSLILDEDLRESEILQLKKQLDREPYVKVSEYISKEQALFENAELMGTNPEDFLGYNPYKPSIEIRLNAAYTQADSIARIEKQLGRQTDIDEVEYRKDLLDAVNENIRTVSWVLLTLAAVLTLISFALINNTIRLEIYAKRFLIHTMKLVGASRSFIRRPLVWRHVWMGMLAACLAGGLLWSGAYALINYKPGLVSVISPAVMVKVSVAVLIAGAGLTWLCATCAVNGYLKKKREELF